MSERTYPVPKDVITPLLGAAPTISSIDRFVQSGCGLTHERIWAKRVRDQFVDRQFDILGLNGSLPVGAVIDSPQEMDIVVGLYDPLSKRWWTVDGEGRPPEYEDIIPLSGEEVAFAASAFQSHVGLALRADCPLAILGVGTTAKMAELPSGAKVLAVTDEVDHNAVMDVIAVAPGPVIYRRHDGGWQEDDDYLLKLRSIKPPPVHPFQDGDTMLAGVLSQIDESTKGKPFSREDVEKNIAAGAYDERLIDMLFGWGLLADVGKHVPGDPRSRMPGQLQRYWVYGKGAAKIRWGTPGAMTRCHRHLMKYMTSGRAWKTCNNISKQIGGKGIAWDVGHGVKKAVS